MLRYKNEATLSISIDLQNEYTIVAMANWDGDEKKYHVTLYMKRNDIDDLKLIGRACDIEFESSVKDIKTDIAKYVTTLLSDGFFEYYIRLYEYEQQCFDRGFDLYEQERTTNAYKI